MLMLLSGAICPATEYHVATQGDDSNRGTRARPFRTIQRAADAAQPGDVITVHEGVYRERINPPRGGTAEQPITYRAGRGEKVEIKGSERVKNWARVQENVWKVTLPNSFFGTFNPYTNLISGDWFDPRGRRHHAGAVYLNNHWLVEATKLEEVLAPAGVRPAWLNRGGQGYLLNVAWLRPHHANSRKVGAATFASQQGVQAAPCSEGGECIGWVEAGDWVQYEGVDFGAGSEEMEIRVASATQGGFIEVRSEGPGGELLGTCRVPSTGDWQSWTSTTAKLKRIEGVRTVALVFRAPKTAEKEEEPADTQLWFSEVDATNTTIWAQFSGIDPNEAQVEINVRQAVFYPDQPGRNYITVRGFALRHAATPWAPPTAEQVGLIGTHWSKGWVIEDNEVSHSVCVGIALGKYGDQWDNTSANTAEGYVKTIERALENGWNRDTIGHHIVRNNTISHCEQAGVVGSLGAAFSTVSGNTIHHIHVRRLFSGAEMAGIKFHAAIDSVIAENHIYQTCLGLWLDWMAQGTRVTGNVFRENDRDLFVEVNHGPFLIDNNLFLSGGSLLDMSEGGAYAHNLFLGTIVSAPEPSRETPYHPAHTTKVAGLTNIKGGDNRFYNNIFVGRGTEQGKGASGFGLAMYDAREYPLQTGGNVFLNGAQPYRSEVDFSRSDENPGVELDAEGGDLKFRWSVPPNVNAGKTRLVDTALLGKAKVPGLPYENPDGSPLTVERDYFGKKRDKRPAPGPFENLQREVYRLKGGR